MSTKTASEARAALPELLDRVEAGEEVTITRHGRAVAVLVRPDTLRARRADPALEIAASVRNRIAEARGRKLSAGSLTDARAEDLIAEIRAGREGR
jgi:antitoxin (DNA-binding transcriptional repressor) of toxin-antitoxin stability system